jgi:hypothetical protein
MDTLLLSIIRFKNSVNSCMYSIMERNDIIIIDDSKYYLRNFSKYDKINSKKKLIISYIYENTKYKTIHYAESYKQLDELHNNFINLCNNTNETFGRKKTYIKSIKDENDNEYKDIINYLPPKKIILDYHTCSLFINDCRYIRVIIQSFGPKVERVYNWDDIKDCHIYSILDL